MGYWSQQPFDLRVPTGRVAWALMVIYFISGITGNIVRVNDVFGETALGAVNVFHLTVVVVVYLAGLWTVVRRRAGLSDYGFTLGRGAAVSLGFVALLMVMNVSLSTVRFSFDVNWALPSILATSLEEFVFRVWLISALIAWPKAGRYRVHIAVAVSAAAWLVPHLVTKDAMGLVNIALGGLVFGYAFYYTRSVLLPLVWHVWSNTQESMGLAGALSVLVAYMLISIVGQFLPGRREATHNDGGGATDAALG